MANNNVDLIAMLDEKHNRKLNIKELPPPNKHGVIKFDGYMDSYFGGVPPAPAVNWVMNNNTLELLQDLTPSY